MKKFLKILITLPIIVAIIIGIIYGFKNCNSNDNAKENIFSKVQVKPAEVTEFFTYGNSLNISCKLSGLNKDNYESARLIVTDGKKYEKEFKLSSKFEDKNVIITTSNSINDAINLDTIDSGNYYLLLRVKVNNSANHKYYLLKNKSQYENIEYYTITRDSKNKKINLEIAEDNYNETQYSYMKLNVEEVQLPEEIYDIVIDAGHGGTDSGEVYNGNSEEKITLEYANLLKNALEQKGFKVKLTRDNSNTESFSEKSTYDSNGRISIACKTKAKYMLSLHVNNGNTSFSGVEVYAPCKSNLNFARKIAGKIVERTSLEYSNVGKYKKEDGVYVKNFSNADIQSYNATAAKNGYDSYNINTDTPLLYTIREVGGVATNAFVDGRNPYYSENKYYNSNQGIECYQIELGYIKTDIEKLLNEKETYVQAIADVCSEEIK